MCAPRSTPCLAGAGVWLYPGLQICWSGEAGVELPVQGSVRTSLSALTFSRLFPALCLPRDMLTTRVTPCLLCLPSVFHRFSCNVMNKNTLFLEPGMRCCVAQHPVARASWAARSFGCCQAVSWSLFGTGQLCRCPLTMPCGNRAVVEVMQRAFVLFASCAAVDKNTVSAGLGFLGPR